jgi:hypothetical protein
MMVADTTKDELKQYGGAVSSSTKSSAFKKQSDKQPAKQSDKKGEKKRPPRLEADRMQGLWTTP